MKNKTSIPLMIVAIATMIILLSFDNLESAYALEIIQRATGDAPRTVQVVRTSTLDLTAVLNQVDRTVSVYDTSSTTLLRTISLASGYAGLGSPSINNIACSTSTYCVAVATGITPNRVFAFNIATGSVSSCCVAGLNSTVNRTDQYGLELSCDIQCTVWVFVTSASPPAGTIRMNTYGDGGDLLTQTWVLSSQFDTLLGTSDTVGDAERGVFTISGNTYPFMAYYYSTGSFRVVNLGTSTSVCTIVVGAGLTNPDIYYSRIGSNAFWLLADGGNGVRKITHASPTSCAISNTLDTATYFEANAPVSVSFNTNNGDIYAYAGANIYQVNGTSFVTTAEYTTSLTGVRNSMGYDSIEDTLVQGINTDDVINFFRFEGTFEEETPTLGQENGVCLNVDANGDGRINVLDCVGSVTAFEGFTSGQNATDVTSTITDGLGLTNCGDNPDHETCGSGLFLFIIALLIFEGLALALYLGFTTKLNADKQLVDILLIMLMIGFSTLALGFYLNWIPDIVFYAIVVLIAGFLTFGIITKFRGG